MVNRRDRHWLNWNAIRHLALSIGIALAGFATNLRSQEQGLAPVRQASHAAPAGMVKPNTPVEVRWLSSAAEAARLAKESGKPILVYVRSENCAYCDKLQEDTWQNPRTQALVMREMIPLKLTLENNPDAIEAMKVKGFPSTILFTPDRQYLVRIDGYVTPEEFMNRISKVRSAPHSTKQAAQQR